MKVKVKAITYDIYTSLVSIGSFPTDSLNTIYQRLSITNHPEDYIMFTLLNSHTLRYKDDMIQLEALSYNEFRRKRRLYYADRLRRPIHQHIKSKYTS